jgi:tRNA(Ile)-lysidine synthase
MKRTVAAFERNLALALDEMDSMDDMDVLCPGRPCLVGISGGPDSTALLAGLAEAARRRKASLFALHVDHGVRGAEARADCQAARDLARSLDVPFRAIRLRMQDSSSASEDDLREGRFRAIQAEARQRGLSDVFLGHHADDLAETLLMRLIRGAGLEGLASFGPVESWRGLRLLRPLIGFSRQEILDYLEARGLEYRHDRSNEDTRFLRNRLRRRLIPLIAETENPQIRPTLARTARQLKRDADFLGGLAEEILERRARWTGKAGAALDVSNWGDLHEALRTRVLRAFCLRLVQQDTPPYSRHLADLDRLARVGRNGSHITAWNGLVAFRDGATVRFVRPETPGRPAREVIYEALREQTLADASWTAPFPLALLRLGQALIRGGARREIDLAKRRGRVGDLAWALEPAEDRTDPAPLETAGRADWSLEFRWPRIAELRLAPAPLDAPTISRRGRKPKTAASRLAAGSRPIARFWREAAPALLAGRNVLYLAGPGPLGPLYEPKAQGGAPLRLLVTIVSKRTTSYA